MKITLSVVTLYLLMFTAGLFAGDIAVTKVIYLERVLGFLSTAVVYSLGSAIMFRSIKKNCCTFAALLSFVMVMTQTAFVFNIFPMPVVHVFYYLASILTMMFIFILVHKEEFNNSESE